MHTASYMNEIVRTDDKLSQPHFQIRASLRDIHILR